MTVAQINGQPMGIINPLTNWVASHKVKALMIKVKIPSVSAIKGLKINLMIGFKTKFKIPKTIPIKINLLTLAS